MSRRSVISLLGVLILVALYLVQVSSGPGDIETAFEAGQSDVWLSGEGTVVRTLPDDNEGSRHQRFIVELASGHTVLVSHNIDLAPRLDGLEVGDLVSFHGEYEWNDRGGVIHWTHHDPDGRRMGGWVEFEGQQYR
ncbi:MAG: DUF3465 domain-containing protein [Rhodothermales bacterium]|nr:DUF3465 domain-containing protein [Rhodothermales bacterium]MBO6780044.1 DUF3465 domain-containing protein [Rhodothermales bacterium]